MEQEILNEIRQLKGILSGLIGPADTVTENPFSKQALDKAKREFLKISVERGEWVREGEVRRYIHSAPGHPGALIRREFEFSSWFRRGREYLYAKKDLIALNEELMARNIDLKRYEEYLKDKALFDKNWAALTMTPGTQPFKIRNGLRNIRTSEIPRPCPDKARQDLERLKQEFKSAGFSLYIDVYQGAHAILKHSYHYDKYLEPGLKKRCVKWCGDFNYANRALKLITGKMEKFPVADPEPMAL